MFCMTHTAAVAGYVMLPATLRNQDGCARYKNYIEAKKLGI